MNEELKKRCVENAAHIKALCGVDVSITELGGTKSETEPCAFRGYCAEYCVSEETHAYGSSEAYRWNGKYVYFCPAGLVFAAAPVSDETGELAGGFVAGPMVMGDRQDTLAQISNPKMRKRVERMPVISADRVNNLSSLLAASAAFASGVSHGKAGSFEYRQDKLYDTLYTVRGKLDSSARYPIEYENELRSMILTRDKVGAQSVLNELLGHIYFSNSYDFRAMKARVIELTVILSRAIIDAGADIKEVFILNNSFFGDIDRFTTFEELNVWLTGIMHSFINYSFEMPNMRHSDIVYKIIDYIKENYHKKILLDDLARHVYLSRSYISTTFREETGYSLSDYITLVRIEKGKQLLLDNRISVVDIAGMCGFEDQSYFTKVFRRLVGVTPKRYRDNRGRVPAV